ncbi:hypothetical protein VPAG_00060 [Vibrio phage douglas 12A4]|uniref:hypothetical protein n=1 Tax=Vibrio phage douglas 12A4 TaxID=573171 RepID=UPI0002C0EBA2|nr:hypothetical protein VPAG_00060 [Vibrio phage douglas 12A4]AGG58096.1 hypothetical protein VPAG_00060 [Vibrio phage douglas 12A4]
MARLLYSGSELVKRYSFMAREGETFTKETLLKWKKRKKFPEPVAYYPLAYWRSDVHEWEDKNNINLPQ